MTDLKIRGVDEKFERMIKGLHAAYKKGIPFKFEANFSGSVGDFKQRYSDLDPEILLEIVKKEYESSEMETS